MGSMTTKSNPSTNTMRNIPLPLLIQSQCYVSELTPGTNNRRVIRLIDSNVLEVSHVDNHAAVGTPEAVRAVGVAAGEGLDFERGGSGTADGSGDLRGVCGEDDGGGEPLGAEVGGADGVSIGGVVGGDGVDGGGDETAG